jgi:hypothetical protein
MTNIALDYEHLSDVEFAALVVRRDPAAVRLITRRNNRRLYRVAWSILKDRAEAEGVCGHRSLCRRGIAVHLVDADRRQRSLRQATRRAEAIASPASASGDHPR